MNKHLHDYAICRPDDADGWLIEARGHKRELLSIRERLIELGDIDHTYRVVPMSGDVPNRVAYEDTFRKRRGS